ncbi:shikimate kinase [Acidovorax sp. SRB_24]|uniref:shikimate kinase n=1 Tax=Acidovorax sp. SRB_24 TaxID=1962700 RepID=UPI00197BAC07|nr:shikimate kinase [Acidovorax sp. SRB_24]
MRENVSSVVLVGLPGSGKSTIGRHLARRLGVACIDSDHVIEHRIGCPIREFFEREGEEAFRAIEEASLDELTAGTTPAVLSTGGGAVLRAANRAHLRERGHVVYLHALPEDIYRRLRHDTTRPLLQVDDPLGRLRGLYAQRDPLYRETAHFVIETGRPSVATLVNMVVMQLELADALPRQRAGGPGGAVPRQ